MDADEARFHLLLKELDSIQQGIQAMDNSMFKIKGWSITLAAAAAGLAANERRPLIAVIGMVTAVCFWLLEGNYKALQRTYIVRDLAIEGALRGVDDPIAVLRNNHAYSLKVPGLASSFLRNEPTYWAKRRAELARSWHEALKPIVFSLYLFIVLCLALEMVLI
jgi:hypothetical protein